MDLGERLEMAITKAAARGIRIDLGRPIPEYENYEPHVDPPRRRDVRRGAGGELLNAGIPGILSAGGRETRSGGALGRKHEEFGFAAAGMDPLQLSAILWCLGMDDRCRTYVRAELFKVAVELKEREHWPPRIRRAECELTGLQRCQNRYVEDLCTLALREGADPHLYGSEGNRALWFGLSERHWRRSGLANGYQGLYGYLSGWYHGGLEYLKQRLRGAPSRHAASGQVRG
ncbi:MAG: hypothetical protein ABI640_13060 [Gammaproteobacteria bacterium]